MSGSFGNERHYASPASFLSLAPVSKPTTVYPVLSRAFGLIESAFVWRAKSLGHEEMRCPLFLLNGAVMEDHFKEQVS